MSPISDAPGLMKYVGNQRGKEINGEDVMKKAVEDIEFVEFLDPLRSALDGYSKESESKKAEKKGSGVKRKLEKRAEELHEDENGEAENEDDRDDQEEGSNEDDDDE